MSKEILFEAEDFFVRSVIESPCIWNHTIDIKFRHPEAKAKRWNGIQYAMVQYLQERGQNVDGSSVKVQLLKNTWERIRDSYVRYKNETIGKSGSSTKEVDPPDHLDAMRSYDVRQAKVRKRKMITEKLLIINY